MHVGLDIQPLQTGSRRHGIGRSCREFVRNLFREPRPFEITLWACPSLPLEVPDSVPPEAVRFYDIDTAQYGPHDHRIDPGTRASLEGAIERQLMAEGVDSFHILSPFEMDVFMPLAFRKVTPVYTVYDLIPLIFRKHYLDRTRESIRSNYYAVCDILRQATHGITISHQTRSDWVKYLGAEAQNIRAIYLGVDHEALGTERNDGRGPRERLVLGLASFGWNKNTARLMDAFAMLPSRLRQEARLVLFGHLKPEHQEHFESLAARLGIAAQTQVSNYIPDEKLHDLYREARALVFPSLYEGFGFPVIEAMAFGTPVIVSQNSSLTEIAGGEAIPCNPHDPRDISEKIASVLEGPACDEASAQRRIRHAMSFRWESTVARTLEVYQSIHQRILSVS